MTQKDRRGLAIIAKAKEETEKCLGACKVRKQITVSLGVLNLCQVDPSKSANMYADALRNHVERVERKSQASNKVPLTPISLVEID